MSIKFVNNLDEPESHSLFEIGSKVYFATIKTAAGVVVKPTEFVDGLTGESIAFGIPAIV